MAPLTAISISDNARKSGSYLVSASVAGAAFPYWVCVACPRGRFLRGDTTRRGILTIHMSIISDLPRVLYRAFCTTAGECNHQLIFFPKLKSLSLTRYLPFLSLRLNSTKREWELLRTISCRKSHLPSRVQREGSFR